jgi:hypothetical protein
MHSVGKKRRSSVALLLPPVICDDIAYLWLRSMNRTNHYGKMNAMILLILLSVLLSGCDLFEAVTTPIKKQQRAATAYLPTQASIIESYIYHRGAPDEADYEPVIRYHYLVNGTTYESERYAYFYEGFRNEHSTQAVVDQYPPGSQQTIYYDPDDPSEAVIYKEFVVSSTSSLVIAMMSCLLAPIGIVLFFVLMKRSQRTGGVT